MSQFSNQYDAVIAALVNKCEELKAENDRYREALDGIQKVDHRNELSGLDRPTNFAESQAKGHALYYCQRLAREALNKTKE